jgi:glycine/D-amino acid oxidase-like deaminating enzyme
MGRVVVIGAGVVGAATAMELAARGADVTVLDRGEPGGGTSGTTFAMDITSRKTPRAYFELSLRAAARHAELSERFAAGRPGARWLHRAPSVEIGRTDRDREVMAARRDRLTAWGYRAETVPATALGELAGGFDLAALDGETAVVYPDAAWYDPAAFVSRMLVAARCEVRTGTTVTGLERSAGGWTVRAGALTWSADHVVNCAGPDAARIAALVGTELPLTEVPGVIARTGPLPGVRLGAVLSLWSINYRPTRDGGLVLHSYLVDSGLPAGAANNTEAPGHLTADLRRRAAALVPALARPGAALDARVGVRPVPVDGLPLVGEDPRSPGLYTIATHSAIHLAPLLAHLAAGELATGHRPPELEPYAVTRTPGAAIDESLREMTHTYAATPAAPNQA